MSILNPNKDPQGPLEELSWLGTMEGGSVTIGRRQLAALCYYCLKHQHITLDKAREVLQISDEAAEEWYVRAFGQEY